jgi:hypothetical protein
VCVDGYGKGDFGSGVGVVEDGRTYVDCGVRIVDVRRGDEGAPRSDVDRACCDESDLAVDACAGIPAAGGLLRVVDADGDDVFAGVEVWGEVVVEADVAVGAMAEEFSVAVDVGVGHNAVEGDGDAFGWIEFWQRECAAVPGDAGGEEASGGAAGGVFFDRAGDTPIVGEGDGLPVGVVECGRLGVGRVGLKEMPVGGELLDLALVSLRLCYRQDRCEE